MLGTPGHKTHRRRKRIRRSATNAACSCCTQWPAPSTQLDAFQLRARALHRRRGCRRADRRPSRSCPTGTALGTSTVRPANSCSSADSRGTRPTRYDCSPPWKPVAPVFAAVDAQLFVGEPRAASRSRRPTAFQPATLSAMPLFEIHHVVARQLRHLRCGVVRERERLVRQPSRRSSCGSKRAGNCVRPARVPHVFVRLARRVIRLIVLARLRQRGEFLIETLLRVLPQV